jgi:hypothetical protein
MAELSQRELIRLQKELLVAQSNLNRQVVIAELERVSDSLAWVQTCGTTMRRAAPVLAFLAPLALTKKPRGFTLRRILGGGLMCWRIFRKMQSAFGAP